MNDLKLFKVICREMQGSHGTAFVVAKDSAEAYKAVLEYLTKCDFGFPKDRELARVELIADTSEYPKCGTRLYLPRIKP